MHHRAPALEIVRDLDGTPIRGDHDRAAGQRGLPCARGAHPTPFAMRLDAGRSIPDSASSPITMTAVLSSPAVGSS